MQPIAIPSIYYTHKTAEMETQTHQPINESIIHLNQHVQQMTLCYNSLILDVQTNLLYTTCLNSTKNITQNTTLTNMCHNQQFHCSMCTGTVFLSLLKLRLLCIMAVSSSCTLGCYTYFCKSSYSGAPLPWCVEVPPFVIYPGGNPTCFESFLLYPGVQRYIFTQGHILNMPIMSDLLNQDQL